MPDFGKLFIESKGAPINFKGVKLHLADKFPVKNGDKLVISIESTNSKHPQGISISIEGKCEIQGKLFEKGKKIKPIFWADTEVLDPKHMELIVFTKKDFVWIQNICEVEYSYLISNENGQSTEVNKKRKDSGHSGAAMIVEEIEGGRRYRCSDTNGAEKPFPFNDIVFTVRNLGQTL